MPAVHAHTSMLSSNPAQGAILNEMPSKIELIFDAALMKLGEKEVNQLLMRGPDKSLIDLSSVTTEEKMVSAQVIGKNRGPGLYKIYYRIVAQDGHPISGFISYTIGKEDLSKAEVSYEKKSWISEFIHHHTIHIWWSVIALAIIAIWALLIRRRK